MLYKGERMKVQQDWLALVALAVFYLFVILILVFLVAVLFGLVVK
jgi:hypothetical protein